MQRRTWTTDEKLAIVMAGLKQIQPVAGLCRDNQISQALLERIRVICGDHPFWGYRRVGAWLRYREHFMVNKKRIYRLMREADLLIKKRPKPATRTPRSKPKATHPRGASI